MLPNLPPNQWKAIFSPRAISILASPQPAAYNLAQFYNLLGVPSALAVPPLAIYDHAWQIINQPPFYDYSYRVCAYQRYNAIISEQRIGKRKADLIGIHGTTFTGIEIKSERDTLKRLIAQLQAYQHVIPTIEVYTTASIASAIANELPKHIGLYTLNNNGALQCLRPAIKQTAYLNHSAIRECLNEQDVYAILQHNGINTEPYRAIPNTKRYDALSNALTQYNPLELSQLTALAWQHTRAPRPTVTTLCNQLPHYLHPLVLSAKLNNASATRLQQALLDPST